MSSHNMKIKIENKIKNLTRSVSNLKTSATSF